MPARVLQVIDTRYQLADSSVRLVWLFVKIGRNVWGRMGTGGVTEARIVAAAPNIRPLLVARNGARGGSPTQAGAAERSPTKAMPAAHRSGRTSR